MKHWNKITEKLPRINRSVFIMHFKYNSIYHAKLSIYNNSKKKIHNNGKLKDGDIFWEVSNPVGKNFWTTTENFPYWIGGKALIEATLDEKEIEEANRFELMDLQ